MIVKCYTVQYSWATPFIVAFVAANGIQMFQLFSFYNDTYMLMLHMSKFDGRVVGADCHLAKY